MANILLLTDTTTHAAATRTKAALEAGGNTVTVAVPPTIPSASYADGYDLIATARSRLGNGHMDWLRDTWVAGKPLLVGYDTQGVTLTPSVRLGLFESSQDYDANTDTRFQTPNPAAAGHPLAIGKTADYVVQTGLNWSGPGTYTLGAAGLVITYRSGASPGHYLSAVEPGDALITTGTYNNRVPAGAVAPARAVSMAWLYAGQTDYSTDGKAQITAAVNWLTAPPAAAGPTLRQWDGAALAPVTAQGWWDGAAVQPVAVRGWWDGTAIQPLA